MPVYVALLDTSGYYNMQIILYKRRNLMGCLGNLIWFLFGGLWQGLCWSLCGILWCITIIGIPIGCQCFKMASLAFFPFGKDVQYGGSSVSFLANILWIVLSGIPLAVSATINGILLCCTIIGIPFGIQCFKIATLALMPFGTVIINN